LVESCQAVANAKLVISADTGLLHVADILKVPAVALMGPTAFGFPSGKKTVTLDVVLACRPCTKDGRGKCSRDVWQKCMVDIDVELVHSTIQELMGHA